VDTAYASIYKLVDGEGVLVAGSKNSSGDGGKMSDTFFL